MAADKTGKELPKGITLRKDGRYQGRYTYNGKRYSIYDTDLKALQKKLRDAKYEVEHGIHAKPEKITLDAWFHIWIEEYKENNVKKGTILTYGQVYKDYIKKELGNKLIKDIRAEQIQKLYNNLYKQGYSISIIKLVRAVLSGMMKQAIKNEIIIKDVMTLVTLPKEKKKGERRVLSIEEQQMLIEYSKESKFEVLILLGLSTGMRIGEMLALEWKDINFKKQTLKVTGTLKYYGGRGTEKDTPKTSSSCREIPLLPSMVNLLKKHKKEQIAHKLQLGDRWNPVKNLEDLVFLQEFGSPFNATLFEKKLKCFINKANKMEYIRAEEENREPRELKVFTPHTLRHTFATRALENGIPPKVVQEILGHSSITMTLDLYTHVLPQTKSEELKKIEGLF